MTTYISPEWSARIRTLPTIQLRARLAVYIIQAYKRRHNKFPQWPLWKVDLDLGHLAYWPRAFRPSLFEFHKHFLCTDETYRNLTRFAGKKPNDFTFCPCQKDNTQSVTHNAYKRQRNAEARSLLDNMPTSKEVYHEHH